MGRARVVAPPPEDYIPEPLVSLPPVPVEVVAEEWIDGNFQEEIIEVEINEPTQEELERERIAQEKHEELQKQKLAVEEETKAAAEIIAKAKEILENPPVRIETVTETVVETVHVTDPKLVEELQILKEKNEKLTRENDRVTETVIETVHVTDPKLVEELQVIKAENEKLVREKEAAVKAKEEQIVKARQQATDKQVTQLNMVQARKPSLLSKVKDFLRRRRIKLATVSQVNYEQAIINQASVAVPKMLDEIEKMHESLTILEELLAKNKERQKIKDR
jgi:hypothetical protein